MGVTIVSATVQSETIAPDDEAGVVLAPVNVGAASVAFNSYGTSPVLNQISGPAGHIRLKTTAGTGSPAIAANNIVVTLANTTRTPRKVYLGVSPAANPAGFHVASVGAGTISIGTKTAPVASAAAELDLVVVF